jgi:hypothetical protein
MPMTFPLMLRATHRRIVASLEKSLKAASHVLDAANHDLDMVNLLYSRSRNAQSQLCDDVRLLRAENERLSQELLEAADRIIVAEGAVRQVAFGAKPRVKQTATKPKKPTKRRPL